MEYKIKFTEKFLEDIEDICKYICRKLKSDKAANALRIKVIRNIENLAIAPKMYSKLEISDRLKMKFRKMIIDNYVIIYTIDESKKNIYISHMYYSGSNYLNKI